MYPILAHAILPPALPVIKLAAVFPKPRSSTNACKTSARPITDFGPYNCIIESIIVVEIIPFTANTFPKSPTCLLEFEISACVTLNGLKWRPVDPQA